MKTMKASRPHCKISGIALNPAEAIALGEVREGVFLLIQKDFPNLTREGYISLAQLNLYRRKYVAWLIHQEKGELMALDQSVVHALETNSILSENIEEEMEGGLTLGQKVADKIAGFGGSWTFILFFFSFILFWMAVNIWVFSEKPFDPYPFILLNLILSCLAAIQAPVIMMSQNRQEQKDRQRSEHDYKINLKAELEIKLLNEKIDYLIIQHNRKLLEIQELQTDYLEDLMREVKSVKQNRGF
jgi:uncharacterized membrane protein